jgi:nicotinamide-nucleotide amidase
VPDSVVALAADLHAALRARGQTVAVAESLTGGALGVALTGPPGASATFRGGVVAYATDLKAQLLGVDPQLLDHVGAVDPEAARQMAIGARNLLGATYAVATTGVAGPDPQDGRPPGEVHLAVAGPGGCTARSLTLPGDRTAVRDATVRAALALLTEAVTAPQTGGGTGRR